MALESLKNKEEKGTMFRSKFLEVFTKTNPVLHILTYGSFMAWCFWMNTANLTNSIIFYILGVLIWTLKEYMLHRFLFHIPASRFQYIIHGIHHEFPRDRERLLMPPLPGTIIFLVFLSFWWIILRENVFIFLAGLLLGYLFYTTIHYIVHAYKPVKPIKFFWEHHHKHHNPKFEDKAFGVSTMLWDYVFGTMPNEKTVSKQ
jgi:sterol desaturase/sphingolipid hydroxylase (fatty acid hydroxylase superfamily)